MAERHSCALPALFGLIWPSLDAKEPTIGPESWNAIAAIARQHRLRPLLHRRCQQGGWQAPASLVQEWAKSHRRAAARALRQKAELVRVTRCLSEAGIAAHVLKGGAIAWRGWFDPAIRPMRDLDLLVPAAQADAAQRLLLAHGFTGPEARVIADGKHLPGLLAPGSGVLVEIHTRLIDALTPTWARSDQAFRNLAQSRNRRLPAKEGGCTVFSDDDTLLHVIVHAVLDNQFNNGPVLLIDIEALVNHGDIDWDRFWATAQEIGAVRAAQLALRLAETVMPGMAIGWQKHSPQRLDGKFVASAASLMLIPLEKRTELGFIGRLARFRWSERSRILLDSMFRNRSFSAAAAQIGGNEQQHGAAGGLARKLTNVSSKEGRSHIKRSLEVANWLRN